MPIFDSDKEVFGHNVDDAEDAIAVEAIVFLAVSVSVKFYSTETG